MIDTGPAREAYINALTALDKDNEAALKFLMTSVAALIDAVDAWGECESEYREFMEGE